MKKIVSIFPLLLIASCTLSKEQYAAGHIGCPANEITVVSETGGWMANSWIAQCRGKTFHCSYMTGGRVSCAEELIQNTKPKESK